MRLPDRKLPWPISYSAVVEIAHSEACHLTAYLCPAGVWTIGWGHTGDVKEGDTCTQSEADKMFCDDLHDFTFAVQTNLVRPANPNQLGAMVSLAYNIGQAGFARSTVLRQHNLGNYQAAARAFGLWNKAGGRVLRGLTTRRAREAALYLTPEFISDAEDMPQRIDPESTLNQSPIAQSGVISVASGVAAAAASAIEPITTIADNLRIDPLLIIGLIAIVVGVVVFIQRKKQRDEGWA